MQTVLDNQIKTVQTPKMDTLMFSLRDREYLDLAVEKRARQNERRLKNWTGERYVKAEAAD